jgi:hypothetical protein
VSLVLDSSATLGWIYLDESAAAAREIFTAVATSGAWVPSIWRLEVANGLQIGVRRRRIDRRFRDRALSDLARLDILVAPETDAYAWNSTLRLAERRFPEEVRRELQRRGHPVDTVGDRDGPCSVEIIRRDPAGTLLAGSDPRRDGWALAW